MKSLYFRFIAIFVALVAAGSALAGYVSYNECSKLLRERFSASISENAAALRNSISGKLEAAERSVSAIASSVGKLDPQAAASYLASAVRISEALYNIYYFGGDGRIVALAYADSRDLSPYSKLDFNEFRDDPNMKRVHESIGLALSSKRPVISEAFLASSGKLLFTIIAPVERTDGRPGVISAALYANEGDFRQMIDAFRTHRQAFIGLRARGGIVGATSNFPVALGKAAFPSSATGEVSIGEGYMHTSLLEPLSGLAVTAGLDESAIDGLLSDLRIKIFSYSLLAAIVVTLLGTAYARTIINPIQDLVAGLSKVGEGVYSSRIENPGGGELAAAAEAFNRMNERLFKSRIIESIWNDRWNR